MHSLKHFGVVNVCPFQPLDAANLAELKVALNGFLQKGETIKLETKVEPVTSQMSSYFILKPF